MACLYTTTCGLCGTGEYEKFIELAAQAANRTGPGQPYCPECSKLFYTTGDIPDVVLRFTLFGQPMILAIKKGKSFMLFGQKDGRTESVEIMDLPPWPAVFIRQKERVCHISGRPFVIQRDPMDPQWDHQPNPVHAEPVGRDDHDEDTQPQDGAESHEAAAMSN